MNRYKILIFIFLSFFSMRQNNAGAQSITIVGDWALSIGYSDLISPPVSDLNSAYDSDTKTTKIKVAHARNMFWQVSVSLSPNTSWPSDFHLYARRTKDGVGNGYVQGGTSFQEVTQIDNYFFDGFLKRRQMWVQYRLTGVSIKIPAGTYSATITYTVVQI